METLFVEPCDGFKGSCVKFVPHLYVVHSIPQSFLVDCVQEGLGHWCNGRTIHGLKVCCEFIAITPWTFLC
jgi:hypothetical protein